MKTPGRRTRQRRSLPYVSERSLPGPRSLWCVDLRAAETTWAQRPVEEVRFQSRGGRLGALLSELDLDPRRPLRHNARELGPARARQLFDALCEELADAVLHDVPQPVWTALLPLLVPHGSGESPYPREEDAEWLPPSEEAAAVEPVEAVVGLVLIAEGRLAAEAAAVACSRAMSTEEVIARSPPAKAASAPPPPPVVAMAPSPVSAPGPAAAVGRLVRAPKRPAPRTPPPGNAWKTLPRDAPAPPEGSTALEATLWTEVLHEVLAMLEAVRDRHRVLLIEA